MVFIDGLVRFSKSLSRAECLKKYHRLVLQETRFNVIHVFAEAPGTKLITYARRMTFISMFIRVKCLVF